MRRALSVCMGLVALGAAAPVAHAGTGTFTNPGKVEIPADSATVSTGWAFPFPATLAPSNLFGPITDVDVTLNGLSHTKLDDLDILLAHRATSPQDRSVILMSDACGTGAVSGYQYTFDQSAAGVMADNGPCNEIVRRPSNHNDGEDDWPTLFPGSSLNDFNGLNPLTDWHLYVHDDASSHVGQLAQGSGWGLSITTGGHVLGVPATGATGPASPYPLQVTDSVGADQVVQDLDVILSQVYHARLDDLDVVLQSPDGQTAMLMSDACGETSTNGLLWKFDDEAIAQMPDERTSACPGVGGLGNVFKPTDREAGESLPAPAPPGPYATSLAVFDGTTARGQWKLWVADDAAGQGGFTTTPFSFTSVVRSKLSTRWSSATAEGPEGAVATLAVQRAAHTGAGPASVRVRTVDGTATAGGDYAAVDRVVSFERGETSKSVTVPLADDATQEGSETFTVALSEATGDAAVAAPDTATVAIPANDPSGGAAAGTGSAAGTTAAGALVPAALGPAVTPSRFVPFRAPSNRRCVRPGRRLRFVPALPLPARLVRTEVKVNGRRALLRRGSAADDPFRLRMGRRAMRVAIAVTTADGRTLTQQRSYRRCR